MQHDALIVGGGLVGLTLALALAQHELTVAVIERADPAAMLAAGFDGRASAIASASARMLRTLGFGETLDREGCPIRAIRVTDGLSPQHLHFETAEHDDPLGIMVENRLLRAWLQTAAAAHPNITLHAPATIATTERTETRATITLNLPSPSGEGPGVGKPHQETVTLTAPLIIAADGRESALRKAAGIRIARWRYPQSAIVTMLAHTEPHHNIASELFYPSGPFALLPMNDLDGEHRSALVWTVDAAHAPGVMKLGPRALAAEAEKRMGGHLGTLRLIAPAATWPLGLHHAERYHARRLILVGDAAHGIHPIAGQGLNMGLRDAAALAQVLVESVRLGLDLGAPEIATRYERWRRFDNSSVAFATDSLNRLFALPGALPASARRAGLATVNRIAPLKRFFMQTARGETGDLPALLQGSPI
ncbi:UbiH/UbiF/VisC/COQ6 family ubiquinone biosynthesis hydroxylase [Sandaracinobacteroides saxicola]|uniref:UbiH/UbiF/VisC/COQ6 family ubiquinone biosynthesis hydroxylase n=1 Tax=Sandaracinobacteroides saxicola TaxID=2759707 RepID=A0A7G5IEL7_9SPHN|nr:UbiH/UbiF/VisC/COQ6 family ubiquinone biosynthesis hydroxylase [Sandaracinobacteroides saxicola]QMW21809.1 UbiH/UbiF/VisC/COQ6 family ubiquinone biosynthesis hydroxylase [Sandaracinobacteroides saxicola]